MDLYGYGLWICSHLYTYAPFDAFGLLMHIFAILAITQRFNTISQEANMTTLL